ncbi:MAG: double-strand break repair protein AddB [Hyphomicrobium sp.]
MSKSVGPRIYSVPASRPFLRSLVEALLEGHLPSPYGKKPNQFNLTEITLYLPNRRSSRALQEAFLREAGGRAMLLPKIFPISEGDEEFSLVSGSFRDAPETEKSIAPATTEMERRLELSRLILEWSKSDSEKNLKEDGGFTSLQATGPKTAAQAVIFAIELSELMDSIESYEINLEQFKKLVPETYSLHWEKTLKLIKILSTKWPIYLSSKKLLSPISHRNFIIDAEALRLKKYPPRGPVIVAGVTGCVPATARLMKCVLNLPNGAIVLPSLDTNLDKMSWERILDKHPEHPQFGLSKILKNLGVERSDVHELMSHTQNQLKEREHFFSEVMRPSSTTNLWHPYIKNINDKTQLENALKKISLIEASSDHEEAETIALILREAIETPHQTAALVTPDRMLARRVTTRLQSWGIRIDDSAGKPFTKTVQGTFLELIINVLTEDFAPTHLVALLKHPFTRLGMDPKKIRRSARVLELTTFRRPYVGTGLDGVTAAFQNAYEEFLIGETKKSFLKGLKEEDWQSAFDLIKALENSFLPLIELKKQSFEALFIEIARAHLIVAENISFAEPIHPSIDQHDQPSLLWQGEGGDAAKLLFQEFLDERQPLLKLPISDYSDFYRNLIIGINVRSSIPSHPRLFIWGPLEARLQTADILVLGSLNEGVWPATPDSGPWLSRGMLKSLGLPSPEERIGLAAHDFFSFICTSQLILTRADKIDGAPTVPSRWINRVLALLEALGLRDALKPTRPWFDWARQQNADLSKTKRIECPNPRPSVELRPRKLSVSQVETFLSNPYAIFAKEILKIEPLPKLGLEPDLGLHGQIIHEVLSRFTKLYPKSLPDDICGTLSSLAQTLLKNYHAHPRINAFWLPKFTRFCEWFALTEPQRRSDTKRVIAEIKGSLVFEAPAGPFTLTARADRIDITPSEILITDYKTGTLPSKKRVLEGISPQLPLEAAIASQSGFPEVPPERIGLLRYIRITGGHPAGEELDIKTENLEALALDTLSGLKRYVAYFDDENAPYRPLRKQRFSYKFDDYTHLARIDEWSTSRHEEWDGADDES